MAARLGGLSPPRPRALAAAAAMARPTLELVNAMAGGGGERWPRRSARRSWRCARSVCCFAHPLLASGAYAAVDASARRELHAAAASSVSDREERARHLALASPAGPTRRSRARSRTPPGERSRRGAPSSAAASSTTGPRGSPRPSAPRRLRGAPMEPPSASSSAVTAGGRGSCSRGRRPALDSGPPRARALIRLCARAWLRRRPTRRGGAPTRGRLEAGGDAEIVGRGAQQARGDAVPAARTAGRGGGAREAAAEAAARLSGAVTIAAEASGRPPAGRGGARSQLSAGAVLEAALELQPRCTGGRAIAQPLFQVACIWLWWDDLERARDGFE